MRGAPISWQEQDMAKPQKTKEQLEALLMERSIGMPIQSVSVFPSRAYGWEATLVASPDLVIGLQAPFEAIVRAAREEFDLKS
jgi:hypothetical protein